MKGFFEEQKTLKKGKVIFHLTDTYFIKESKMGSKIDLPGFGRVLKILESLRNPSEKNVLFVHSGDFLFPSFLSNYFKGKQMVDVLNGCGLDYCTLGNHDFDGGLEALRERMEESKFKYIITNLSMPKPALQNVLSYDVWPREHPIAAIAGIAGKMTARKAADNGFKIKNTKIVLKKSLAEIRQKHPDIKILVVLSHMGDGEDLQLKQLLNEMWPHNSIILGGHDHKRLISYDPKSDRCMLIKGKSNARTVQMIDLSGMTYKKAKNFEKNITVLDLRDFQGIKPSRKMEGRIESWFEKLKKQNRLPSNRIVKKFPKGAVLDGTESSLRKGSTNLGNFVADCLRNYAGSDLAFVNSGHFRCDRRFLEKLRVSDLFNTFVMEQRGVILVTKLTKKECVLFLRHAYRDEGKGKVLQISKDALEVLEKNPDSEEFNVALISDMLFADEDGFGEILAKHRETSLRKLRSSLSKDTLRGTNLIECILKTAGRTNYDPEIRCQVGTKIY